ncbi:sigma factor-like helix-turn-helix DNA-binding protein [Micropruina sp.]|uniref:sigma factor-like helix-turn-helix DNA-binding protein n=1 Tax=Micropruina sp. TaxID=2737536 RepID=UPI0039E646E0
MDAPRPAFRRGCTQREISRRLGLSQMRVSRLLCRILADLRAELDPVPEPASLAG